MSIEKEKIMKDSVALVQELKRKMEKDIAGILKNFENKTDLKPGIVFHERTATLHEFNYVVRVPVNL